MLHPVASGPHYGQPGEQGIRLEPASTASPTLLKPPGGAWRSPGSCRWKRLRVVNGTGTTPHRGHRSVHAQRRSEAQVQEGPSEGRCTACACLTSHRRTQRSASSFPRRGEAGVTPRRACALKSGHRRKAAYAEGEATAGALPGEAGHHGCRSGPGACRPAGHHTSSLLLRSNPGSAGAHREAPQRLGRLCEPDSAATGVSGELRSSGFQHTR